MQVKFWAKNLHLICKKNLFLYQKVGTSNDQQRLLGWCPFCSGVYPIQYLTNDDALEPKFSLLESERKHIWASAEAIIPPGELSLVKTGMMF